MNRLAVVLALLLLAACSSPEPEPMSPESWGAVNESDQKSNPEKLGRQLIDEREKPGSLDRAVQLLEWHSGQKPESVEIHILATEAHVRELDSLDAKKERAKFQRHSSQGRSHGSEAVSRSQSNGAAHYWFGCALLFTADLEQSYGRLKEALAELQKAEKLDPSIDNGGPARMIGRIYQETPGGFMLGSKPKAIEWYKKSLAISPDFLLTHLWLGEALAQDKKPDQARLELEKVLAAKPTPGHEKEIADLKAKAMEVLLTLK